MTMCSRCWVEPVHVVQAQHKVRCPGFNAQSGQAAALTWPCLPAPHMHAVACSRLTSKLLSPVFETQ